VGKKAPKKDNKRTAAVAKIPDLTEPAPPAGHGAGYRAVGEKKNTLKKELNLGGGARIIR